MMGGKGGGKAGSEVGEWVGQLPIDLDLFHFFFQVPQPSPMQREAMPSAAGER